MNPFSRLLQSRRFWLAVMDAVISIALYFAAKSGMAAVEDVRFLIVTMQPVVVILIVAFTYEDVQARRSSAEIEKTRLLTTPGAKRIKRLPDVMP